MLAVSKPLTREQLIAEAERVEAEGARLTAYGAALRELARNAPLTIARDRSIVSSKVEANVATKSRYVRQAASRTRRTSEAKRLLLEAGMTDQLIADALHVGRSTVNAWFGGKRSIPRSLAAKLEKLHGVPVSAWPNVA